MALAIYRKYRPRSFADLIGQDYLVEIFRNAAKQGKIAHAYIFYGPRGTGKTTTARLVAKIANCESVKDGEPCNNCRVCQEVDAGRAMDVIEIDAASYRGIDEIRDIRDSARLSPSSYRRKVFIIDEAHQLTKDAFNALLKTLEEPPPQVMFILATTEFEKIPATITSRAQRFHFRRLTLAEILKKLKMIVAEEKFKIDDEALELVAAAAEGGFRDAESLLDQVTSLIYRGETSIDLKTVEDIIGKVGFRRVGQLADLVVANDLSGALKFLNTLNDGGANLVDLNKELINYFRRVLALKCDPGLEEIYQNELTKEDLGKIKLLSQKFPAPKLMTLIKSLIRAYSEMRYSPFPHIPLEVAIIENIGKEKVGNA